MRRVERPSVFFRVTPGTFRISLLMGLAAAMTHLPALAGGGGGYSGGGGGFSGGGGGFSGGGWSSGSGFSGSGGGGSIDAPGWLIVVIIIIVIIFKLATAGQESRQRSTYRRANHVRAIDRTASVERQLREHDASFELNGFQRRVREAFTKCQRAWCAQDLDTVRPFISDGIHARWSTQLAEQKRIGVRDQVEDLTISGVHLVELDRGGQFEALAVRIWGRVVDTKRRLSDNGRISGASSSQPFEEYWSFIRRVGTVTSGKPGLIEGSCPNCGAPVAHSQHARCQHCQAILRSGEHDWVLAEITQPSEWTGDAARSAKGREAFIADDPGFSLQAMEDRASVLFYRLRAAESWADAARLEGFATETCIATMRGVIDKQVDRNGVRYWIGEAAVGAVRTVAVQHGDDKDRALVEVRWSGVRCFEKQGGEQGGTVKRGLPTPPRRLYLLLERPAAATSDVDTVLSSAHCPSCGAPDTDLAEGRCGSCGTAVAEGGAWLLAEVHEWAAPEVKEWRRKLGTSLQPDRGSALAQDLADLGGADSRAALLAWAVAMAAADGKVTPEEEGMLEGMADMCGVPRGNLPALIESAGKTGDLQLPMPKDRSEAIRWLDQLIVAAVADGSVNHDERMLIHRIGRAAGMDPVELKQRVTQALKQHLADARATIRNARRAGRQV